MISNTYLKVQLLLLDLTHEERKQLLEELTAMVINDQKRPRHNITEFEGLGKDIWKDTDPQEYVNQERDSWDIEPSRYYSNTHSESDKR